MNVPRAMPVGLMLQAFSLKKEPEGLTHLARGTASGWK